jgi:hypothetical protein
VPHELVTPMEVWNTTALDVGDVDGDGHLDLWIGNYFPDGARVLDPAAADDTRMQMQDSMGLARNAGQNHILLSVPAGRRDVMPALTDASTALPADASGAWTLAVGMQDLTGDLLPEVYQANDFGPDQLFLNRSTPGHVVLEELRGRRDLLTPKSKVLGHDSFKGMGVTFSYPPDATLPDIMVSNITDSWALQESNFFFTPEGGPADLAAGRFAYQDQSEKLGLSRSGWSWDVKAADLDNDGRDEFLQATGFITGERSRWAQLQELAMGNDQLLRHPWAWPHIDSLGDLSGRDDHDRLRARR